MPRKCRLAAFLACWLLLLATVVARAQDAIVARVNGKAITEADMRLAETEIGSDLGSLPEATRRRVLLEFLIAQQLFADAADVEKLGPGPSQDARAVYFRRRALREAFFEKSVKSAGLEAEAKAIYDRQIASSKGEEEVRARHILVDTEARAKDLVERVRKGADFAALAKEQSRDPGSRPDGGDLGYFARGQMVATFEETAFKLKTGEVSGPVQSQFGWHIIKLEDRRSRTPPAFEQVRERLIGALMHRRAQELTQTMRANASVEVLDSLLKADIEAENRALPKIIVQPPSKK